MGKNVSKLTEREGRRTLKRMKMVVPVDIPVQVFGRDANLQEEGQMGRTGATTDRLS